MLRSRRSLPAFTASAILLATTVLLAPASRTVEAAGCASHLHALDLSQPLSLSALTELADESRPEAPAESPAPCFGPSCSESPGVPFAPALGGPTLWRELWCHSSVSSLLVRVGRRFASLEAPLRRPVVDPLDVERPPRRSFR